MDPALLLKNNFDEIMKIADCVFTPVLGESDGDITKINNWYTDYVIDYWKAPQTGYVNRSWCRIEMMYAANIPVIPSAMERTDLFNGSLKHYMLHAVRPHFLFSLTEQMLQVGPIALPPLRPHLFKHLRPEEGTVTIKGDRLKISELISQLQPFLDPIQLAILEKLKTRKCMVTVL